MKSILKLLSSNSSPKQNNKCSNLVHSKEDNFYCKSPCMELVCEDCKNFHKDHECKEIKYLYEDIIQQSKDFSKELKDQIEEMKVNKIEDEELFKESVQEHYDTQITTVTNHFKELHDALYYKEVELKRELKSYHDENLETLATVLSKLESDIDESNKFIAEINTQVHTDNDDDYYKNIIKSKHNFIKRNDKVDDSDKNNNNNNSNSNIVKTPTPSPKYYSIYKFQNPLISNSIEKIQLTKLKSIFPLSQKAPESEVFQYLYSLNCHNPGGFFKYDLGSQHVERKTELPPISLNHFGSVFWHNSMVGEKMYIVVNSNCFIFDTSNNFQSAKDIPKKIDIKYNCSTFYDGKEHIYTFPVYETANQNAIHRLNIHTFEVTQVCKFENLSYLNFDMDSTGTIIFIIGGYSPSESWKNSIRALDTRTSEISTVLDYRESNLVISGGAYVPGLNSFFITTWGAAFIQFDMSTRKKTTLTFPKEAKSNYSKLRYDSKLNVIYLICQGIKHLFVYHIADDLWTTSHISITHDITPSCFICLN